MRRVARFLGLVAALLASPLAWGGEPDVPDSLDALLLRLERAVLEADATSYLANIPVDDSWFLTEQRAWFDDVLVKTPVAFDLELADVETIEDEAVGTLVMRFEVERLKRDIEFPARFRRVDGAWKFAGVRWERPVPDFPVYCLEGGERGAESIASIYPDLQAHCEAMLGTTITEPPPVKIFNDMRHLQASIFLSYEDPLAGWNEPGESVKLLANRRGQVSGARTVLAHELGHAATFAMGDHAERMPWWVLEGTAELCTDDCSNARRRADGMVRAWRDAGQIAAWSDLEEFGVVPDALMWHVYTQGLHMIGYITDTYGPEARNAWLRAMAGGMSIEQATPDVLFCTFETLDAAWRLTVDGL
ncbi:MAG: hypothetical protein KDA28_11090 [Phycisphaerales bacterium]|nr:hypothetical protein [Phycisphaerales bacterium]